MNIRTALKICKEQFDWDGKLLKRNYRQVRKAITIGRRKRRICQLDQRFPFIPSDQEMEEQGEMMIGILAGFMVEEGLEVPEELRDIALDFSKFKEPLALQAEEEELET